MSHGFGNVSMYQSIGIRVIDSPVRVHNCEQCSNSRTRHRISHRERRCDVSPARHQVSLLCVAGARGQWTDWDGAPQRWARAARSEAALLGVTGTQYRYLDSDGAIRTVSYTPDAATFRTATSGAMLRTAAPQPVQDTPEVAAAKAQFMAQFRMAQLRAMPAHHANVAPLPVQDTPEVAAAKAEFMAKFRAAQQNY